MKIIPRPEVYEAEDITDFAATMDMDMNCYFTEEKDILQKKRENKSTVIFVSEFVYPKLFEFYILKQCDFKDGTSKWDLCCKYAKNTSDNMVLDQIRGTREDAINKLRKLVSGE